MRSCPGKVVFQGVRDALQRGASGAPGYVPCWSCHADTEDGELVHWVVGGGPGCHYIFLGPLGLTPQPTPQPTRSTPPGPRPCGESVKRGRRSMQTWAERDWRRTEPPAKTFVLRPPRVPGARERVASRRGRFDARGRRHGALEGGAQRGASWRAGGTWPDHGVPRPPGGLASLDRSVAGVCGRNRRGFDQVPLVRPNGRICRPSLYGVFSATAFDPYKIVPPG